jgi:branched-chain amino acid transport system substrate-binding protein
VCCAAVGAAYAVAGVSASSKEIVLGLNNMSTGQGALFGAQYLVGAQVAVDDINKAGGINGRKVKLIVRDSKTDPVQGVQTSLQLLNSDHVDALLCNCFTTIMFPIAHALASKNTVIFSSASSAPALAQQGKNIVSTISTDDQVAPVLADWMYSRHFRRAGVVAPTDQIGVAEAAEFIKKYKSLGGTIVTRVNTGDNLPDYTSEMQRVVSSGAKVLYFLSVGADGQLQFRELNQLGWKGLVFVLYPSGNGLNTDPNANGRVFGIEPGFAAGTAALQAQFRKSSHKAPAWFNGVGYDTVQIAARAVAAAKDPKSAKSVQQAAVKAAGSFTAATGKYHFNSHYIRTNPAVAYFACKNGQFIQVTKAGKVVK